MSKKSPIILAILCAVGVHTVLFTDAGHRMQGAITESTQISTAESRLVITNDSLEFIIDKDLKQVKKITASLMYDTEGIEISEGKSHFWNIEVKNGEYSQDIVIDFKETKNISKNTSLVTWSIKKKDSEVQAINLSEVSVQTENWDVYMSTQGTGNF